MEEKTIRREALVKALLTLFDEGYLGNQGSGTWYIDSEAGSGLYGTIGRLDAAAASRPLTPGDPLTAASHVDHLRFSLSLANRATRGDNPYPTADWAGSWAKRSVNEAEWKALVAALKEEVETLREALAAGHIFGDEDLTTGVFGLVSHTAWHLGALRQGLGLVAAPGPAAGH